MIRAKPSRVRRYAALLRAVNVGGTGKLPMDELKAMCTTLGFGGVRTYIASGNVVFDSSQKPRDIQSSLEEALEKHAGKPVGVCLRTADEMQNVLERNPFPKAPPNRVIVYFCNRDILGAELTNVAGQNAEELSLGKATKTAREYFIYYPESQADTKLKLPAAKEATGRNINTVAKLLQMLRT